MKKFISALLCVSSFSFASMIGLEAMGQEQIAGGSAAMAGRGFAGNAKTGDAEGVSVVNPARQAFDSKVALNLNFLLDVSTADRSKSHYTKTNLSMPSMNLSFPMGDLVHSVFRCGSIMRARCAKILKIRKRTKKQKLSTRAVFMNWCRLMLFDSRSTVRFRWAPRLIL